MSHQRAHAGGATTIPLDLAVVRQRVEQHTCSVNGQDYCFTLRRATVQPFAAAAGSRHAVSLEVAGIRMRNGCAMSPGTPVHVAVWSGKPEEVVAAVEAAWVEAIVAMELQDLAEARLRRAEGADGRTGGHLRRWRPRVA